MITQTGSETGTVAAGVLDADDHHPAEPADATRRFHMLGRRHAAIYLPNYWDVGAGATSYMTFEQVRFPLRRLIALGADLRVVKGCERQADRTRVGSRHTSDSGSLTVCG